MPKLTLAVGLEDEMDDIIEELIAKGQQLDAVNFAYEAGLQDKYPPVPLLKSYLDESVKSSSFVADNQQTGNNAGRKEQAALRAAIKCIEDHNLSSEFPLKDLHSRLETLEKAKIDKKKPLPSPTTSSNSSSSCTNTNSTNGTNSTASSAPPSKRTRTNNTSYMGPTFVRSPPHIPYQVPVPVPAANTASHYHHAMYGSRSPQTIRDPYVYPTDEVASIAMSYPSPPVSYSAYGGYNNGMAGYGFHQVYYHR